MKIVIDTNIFVSSFFWGGNPRKIFDRVMDGLDELYITDEILDEITEVMARNKFNLELEKIEEYAKIIENRSVKVFPYNNGSFYSRDRDDNKFIICGIIGRVDYIISGDNHLLELEEINGIKIMSPKKYLEII